MQPRYENYDSYAWRYKKNTDLPCVLFVGVRRTYNNKSYSANWHEGPELQYIVEGEGYVLIDGERYEVTAGDIAVANSNCVHYTGTDTRMRYTAMIINFDFFRFADIDLGTVSFETVIRSERLERLFSDVLASYGEEGRKCHKARVQRALLSLIIELGENHTASENKTKSANQRVSVAKDAMHYIRQHYANKITLDMLAEAIFTDKYALSRKFKAVTGQTVVEYLNNYRCERAKELIQNGTPINEAAVKCGFNNMSFFTRTFKTFTGKLPSEYKK